MRKAIWGSTGAVVAVLGIAAQCATAQEPRPTPAPGVQTEHTFYLHNTRTQADQNEILTAMRNMISPSARIFLIPWQNAIAMEASPDQVALAEKLIHDLDLPRKVYRLTYTLTEMDGGKRVGVQHFSLVVSAGLRSQMKQGNRVPLVTSTTPGANAPTVAGSTQITYIDVGLNVDATVDSLDNGVGLRTKVEMTGVAGELSSTLSQDPVLRQTMFEGTSVLTLGKPLELGSLDVLGSTRHTQVEVVADAVK